MTPVGPERTRRLAVGVRLFSLIARRVVHAVLTWPSLRAWAETFLTFACLAAFLVPFTIWRAWYSQPPVSDPTKILSIVVAAFFVPALSEELICRAMMIPHKTEQVSRLRFWIAIAVSLAFYIGVHPLNGFLNNQPFFLRPDYILVVFLLGICCTVCYVRTGSIWSPVFIHMATVGGWGILRG